MKRLSLLTAFCVCFLFSKAQTPIQYEIDLSKTENDKIKVSVAVPKYSEEKIVFGFPKIVPGTYSISDFGRFVDNLKAFDAKGIEATTVKLDVNKWEISNTNSIAKIEYEVNDTYDDTTGIFEPGGINIQKDTNYVLNLFGVLGYVGNHLNEPVSLRVLHSESFYGSTSLIDKDNSNASDLFAIENYHVAADNPVMYSAPDTATVRVGNTDVLISVFSAGKNKRAGLIAKSLDTLLQAQGKYLGGKLPVEKYSFMIYMAEGGSLSGGYGALEHSYSSLYYMPEMPNKILIPQLREIAAHEFFHIITPLNIHSEEIHYFDYDNPKMSEHLWLYEGTTEYHAHAVQVKYNFYSPEEFLNTLKMKMTEAQFGYNDTLPFTEMSKGCLDTFEDQYPNVYAKGALIGMCLDLQLLHESKGKYGLINLLDDLAKKYGKDKPFKDEELFDVITSLTYPSVRNFLDTYVAGTQRLPFKEMLGYAGVKYTAKEVLLQFTMGMIDIGYNEQTGRLIVSGTENINAFGKTMGYKKGDEILKINGKKITPTSFKKFRSAWGQKVKEGDKLIFIVLRKNEAGAEEKVKLQAKVFKSEIPKYHLMEFEKTPTEAQLTVKKAWLGK